VGVRHNVVGASFGWPEPLTSPPLRDRRNKILWMLSRPARTASTADLLISASLNGSDLHVQRRVEGQVTPGSSRPSVINLPAAGCWTFSLRWGDQNDVVSVRYVSSD
jgi:hypothetical protein